MKHSRNFAHYSTTDRFRGRGFKIQIVWLILSLPTIDPPQLHVSENQTRAHDACQSYLILPETPCAVVNLLMIKIHFTSHPANDTESEHKHLMEF